MTCYRKSLRMASFWPALLTRLRPRASCRSDPVSFRPGLTGRRLATRTRSAPGRHPPAAGAARWQWRRRHQSPLNQYADRRTHVPRRRNATGPHPGPRRRRPPPSAAHRLTMAAAGGRNGRDGTGRTDGRRTDGKETVNTAALGPREQSSQAQHDMGATEHRYKLTPVEMNTGKTWHL